MSVVCTKVFDDRIIIAADSQVTHGWTAIKDNKTVKVFSTDLGMLIGGVGDAQPITLLKMFTKTHVPADPTTDGIAEFLYEFHEWLEDHSNDVDNENSYHFLYKGHAFAATGYHIQEITTFSAIGSGMEYSLAALHLGHSPYEAVKVSCELNIYCAEPITTFVMYR